MSLSATKPGSGCRVTRAIQANRAISTGKLHALLRFHTRPINVVVYHGSQGRPRFEAGFPLRCLQRLSLRNIATLHCGWRHNRSTRGMLHPGPLVLRTDPLKSPTPTADRDQTVSRRFEPNSRTTLIGEQPNPWDLLQPQDVMSRHRGAKRPPSIWTLGRSSACYPRRTFYPLSDGPSHAEPPDHYDRLSSLLDLSVSQSGRLMPLHSDDRFPTSLSPPSRASVTLWEATAPVKLPTMQGPGSG